MGELGFEGVVNARDVGGIGVEGGGRVRTGVLYRSETPQLMTGADLRLAVDGLGIRRVIDLRGPVGRGSGALGGDGRGVVIDFIELAGGHDRIVTDPDRYLPGLLDGAAPAVAAVLEHLVAAEGPVLIHCHTGKDRTGFTIALILALVGAADDAIVADYERSIPVFTTMLANLGARGMAVPDTAPAYAREAPSPGGIRALLARLRSEWPTPRDYLLAGGADPGVIDATVGRLVDGGR